MAKKQPDVNEFDMLRGMKSICDYLRMSEATVLKYIREYDDFPVKKNGNYISSRTALNDWVRGLVMGR